MQSVAIATVGLIDLDLGKAEYDETIPSSLHLFTNSSSAELCILIFVAIVRDILTGDLLGQSPVTRKRTYPMSCQISPLCPRVDPHDAFASRSKL